MQGRSSLSGMSWIPYTNFPPSQSFNPIFSIWHAPSIGGIMTWFHALGSMGSPPSPDLVSVFLSYAFSKIFGNESYHSAFLSSTTCRIVWLMCFSTQESWHVSSCKSASPMMLRAGRPWHLRAGACTRVQMPVKTPATTNGSARNRESIMRAP